MNLTKDRIYYFVLEFADGGGEAHLKAEWSSPSIPKEVIPQSQLLSPEPVKGVPSIPEKSTVVTFSTSSIAGNIYEMTMQSHNSLGIAINTKSDVYSVTFTRSDSGGS